MKKIFMPLVFAALTFTAVSCSDDDKTPSDPEGTVALNMLNESNGKTQLDDSGIYIDKAYNFVGNGNCAIFALGKSSGLGALDIKSFDNPASQAAVQAGHGYAAVRPAALMEFPSGKLALPIDNNRVNYLKFYVVSPITEGDKTIGAAIKYATVQPEIYGLPEYGTTVLTINEYDYEHLGQEVTLKLPVDDLEYHLLSNDYKIFAEKRGRKLVFWVEDWFDQKFELYLRIHGSYTKVYVDVNLSY